MNLKKLVLFFAFIIIFRIIINVDGAIAKDLEQIPTGSIPTVTGTPTGPLLTVLPGNEEQINVRSGPGVFYPKVGVLLVGQRIPAIGRSPGGDWIQVDYPGVAGGVAWVYAPYVQIFPPTQLRVIEPPPTPTPRFTQTIDPTFAAQFVITVNPAKLPTYTPPPPLIIPTFEAQGSNPVNRIPIGMVILGLAAVGILLGLVSFSQR